MPITSQLRRHSVLRFKHQNDLQAPIYASESCKSLHFLLTIQNFEWCLKQIYVHGNCALILFHFIMSAKLCPLEIFPSFKIQTWIVQKDTPINERESLAMCRSSSTPSCNLAFQLKETFQRLLRDSNNILTRSTISWRNPQVTTIFCIECSPGISLSRISPAFQALKTKYLQLWEAGTQK